jgi:phage minor structural protein, N-terminal region
MMPKLYDSTETSFTSNGIGALADCVSCTVEESMNGAFELEMEYPTSGIHFEKLALRKIITAKPDPVRDPQPFRIYEISRPLNGIVTVSAEHISYDLTGIPVSTFTAGNITAALSSLKSKSVVTNPFTFWTDKTTQATMEVSEPASIRSLLGGSSGSILDVYGGEYEFDKYTVKLYNARGQNRGVSVRYGKNLTDIQQEENCANVYTGVYAYWKGEDALVETSPKVIAASGTYNFTRIKVLDLSSEFDSEPTPAQLKSKAQTYMTANNIGVPKVSISVSFAQLEQSEEYKNIALLERVSLCDTVNVEFPELGVSTTAKCVKIVYDVLLNKIKTAELGDARTSLESTISDQAVEIQELPDKTFLQKAVDNATSLISGNSGGYVVLHSSTGEKTPDEILIMDTNDIATATKVWRWNNSGLGYSSNGYNGPFALAMTKDGAIVADFITTGSLSASLIKTGTLDAKNITVKNITATNVNMDGAFTSESGKYKSRTWSAQSRMWDSNALRARLYITNASQYTDSFGILQLFGGSSTYSGDSNGSDFKYTALTAHGLELGKDSGGNYIGDAYMGTLRTKNACFSGTLQPNSGQNALYLDWKAVQDMDGNQQWALCGFTSPQG